MRAKPINAAIPRAVAESGKESKFRVYAKAPDEGPAELLIFDQIGEDWFGDGVSATSVVSFLAENKGRPVDVRINSFGGDVYDGFVIFNALSGHDSEVTITVEGIAFSAASYIALAGDKLRMHKNSDIGVHRAATIAWGNQNEMESVRNWLATIDDHLVDIYEDKTGKSREEITGWIDGKSDGTVFSASQAVEVGLADEMIEPPKKKKWDAKEKIAEARRAMSFANQMAIRELRS